MSAFDVELEIFREILVLPLRLTSMPENPDWTRAFSKTLDQRWLRQYTNIAPQSRAYTPSSLAEDKKNPLSPIESLEDFNTRWQFAEQVYFHPSVQKFLYQNEACKTFRLREQPKHLRFAGNYGLVAPEGDSFVLDLKVDDCLLTLVPEPGLAILTLEVFATSETTVNRFKSGTPEALEPVKLSLAEALAIHDSLRRLFPPFFLNLTGGKRSDLKAAYDEALFPISVEFDAKRELERAPSADDLESLISELKPGEAMPYANWWRALLAPVLDDNRFSQVVDDRIPSMVYVGLRQLKKIRQSDFVRLCFADHPGKGLPYDSKFKPDFMRDHAYTRFSHVGTTWFASSYSFVCVAEMSGPLNSFSFGQDVIQEHFRRHYAKMFFIVQMQKAALLAFSAYLADAVAQNAQGSSYLEKIRKVREGFVSFTHRFWFSNVSNQEQARELFKLMHDHSGNPTLFQEVHAESTAAREELAIRAAESQAESAFLFNVLIAMATIIGLPLAYFGTHHAEHSGWPFNWVLALACGVAAFAVAGLAVHQRRSGISKNVQMAVVLVVVLVMAMAILALRSGP